MADVFEFLQNLKKPVFETPPITYGAPPPQIQGADPNNPLGKLSLPPLDNYAGAPATPTPAPVASGVNLTQPLQTKVLPTAEGDDDADIKAMMDRFQPEHRASDAYYEMLSKMPQEETNVPLGRRILAGLSTQGQGGIKESERILQAPFLNKLGDFERRSGILKDLSAAERGSNTNDRMIMSQLLLQKRSERIAAEKERHNVETEAAAKKRTELAEYMKTHPNHQLRVDDNGEFEAFNPREPGTPPIKTGVKSGEMSELARLMMVQSGQTNRQLDKAEFDKEMEDTRQRHRKELAELEARLRVDTQYGKPITPTEIRIARFNAASKLWNSDPANKKFISLGQPGSNDFEIKMPIIPFWRSDAAKKEALDKFEAINQKVYGNDWEVQNPEEAEKLRAARTGGGQVTRTTTTSSTQTPAFAGGGQGVRQTKQQRNTKTGEIRTLESTDGGKTWTPVKAGK